MRSVSALAVVWILLLSAVGASAQSLGTFRWQLQPYCNVVSVNVVQAGGVYQLDGVDEQCGAATRGAVSGLAFPNPDGSIGFGLTVVRSPGGSPLHIDASIVLATLSGTWRDGGGRSGSFQFNPPTVPAGSPIPAASVITGVVAGAGLTGGATSGGATLAIDFAGSGSAPTAARSDHQHATVQFRVGGYGSQAIADNVPTVLNQWGSPLFDEGGGSYAAPTGIYTVSVTGLYLMGCRLRWGVFTGPLPAGSRFGLSLQRNAANLDVILEEPSPTNAFQVQEISTVHQLSAGDSINCAAFQDTSSAQPAGSGSQSNSGFWVVQLR